MNPEADLDPFDAALAAAEEAMKKAPKSKTKRGGISSKNLSDILGVDEEMFERAKDISMYARALIHQSTFDGRDYADMLGVAAGVRMAWAFLRQLDEPQTEIMNRVDAICSNLEALADTIKVEDGDEEPVREVYDLDRDRLMMSYSRMRCMVMTASILINNAAKQDDMHDLMATISCLSLAGVVLDVVSHRFSDNDLDIIETVVEEIASINEAIGDALGSDDVSEISRMISDETKRRRGPDSISDAR